MCEGAIGAPKKVRVGTPATPTKKAEGSRKRKRVEDDDEEDDEDQVSDPKRRWAEKPMKSGLSDRELLTTVLVELQSVRRSNNKLQKELHRERMERMTEEQRRREALDEYIARMATIVYPDEANESAEETGGSELESESEKGEEKEGEEKERESGEQGTEGMEVEVGDEDRSGEPAPM